MCVIFVYDNAVRHWYLYIRAFVVTPRRLFYSWKLLWK